MSDNAVLAIMAAILSLRGDAAVEGHARDAANIAAIFGLKVSEHTQDLLKIRPIYGDDLAVLPGRRTA